MKKTSIIAVLSVLICFGLCQQVQAAPVPDTPDPGSVGGSFNTADDANALANSTGSANSAFGWFSLFSDTDGGFNSGFGAGTLIFNTGNNNTAVGAAALLNNTTGSGSTAVGAAALLNNTADANTATGAFALQANTTGGTLETSVMGFALGPNTAVGSHALESNTDSSSNTAVGYQALRSTVTGFFGDEHLGASTAVGFQALANVDGPENAINDAFGYQALFNLSSGYSNVAIGFQALTNLTDGIRNVAIGTFAGGGLTTGDHNVYIGPNVTAGAAGEDDTIRIGTTGPVGQSRCFIAGISGVNEGGTISALYINTAGQLGTQPPPSSRRFKKEIKLMDKASEAILALKPVTFHYKTDAAKTAQFGLIAEEVAEVSSDLVVCDQKGEIYTVRYDQVNAMLLNEFLKEHRKVEKQEATIAQLKQDFQFKLAEQQKGMEGFTAQLKEQAAQIQKVSAQLEVCKPATKVVLSNHP